MPRTRASKRRRTSAAATSTTVLADPAHSVDVVIRTEGFCQAAR